MTENEKLAITFELERELNAALCCTPGRAWREAHLAWFEEIPPEEVRRLAAIVRKRDADDL